MGFVWRKENKLFGDRQQLGCCGPGLVENPVEQKGYTKDKFDELKEKRLFLKNVLFSVWVCAHVRAHTHTLIHRGYPEDHCSTKI